MDIAKLRELKPLTLEAIGVRYGFQFSKVGDKLRSLCLFHGDSGTPNLFVYPDDTFFCYACRRGGPKSSFVAYAEGIGKDEVEKAWSDMEPVSDVVLRNLSQPEFNYRQYAQLLIARAFYAARLRDPKIPISALADYDAMLSSRVSITKDEYAEISQKIADTLGGAHV